MSTALSGAETRPAYQAIVDELAQQSVQTAFGLMGEDTAHLVTDLERAGIAYYGAMHENVAISMACGYAWSAGELGVAVISRGPGVTNAASALASAVADQRRLLVIVGEQPGGGQAGGTDLKGRIPQDELCVALGLAYYTATEPGGVLDALHAALASASVGAPALLAVPIDLLETVLTGRDAAPRAAPPVLAPIPAPEPADDDIREAATLLARARRPLILAGRGAVIAGAREALIALAERTGALLGTSLMGKDLFNGHVYEFGLVGGCTSEAGVRLLAEIDCVVVFGASLNFFTTANGTLFRDIPVVQFDRAEAGLRSRFLPATLGAVADAKLAAERLLAASEAKADRPLHAPDVLERLPSLRAFSAEQDTSRGDAIDPRLLVATLDELLPDERTVLSDGGHTTGFPMMHLRWPDPDHYLLPVMGVGAIGMGLGSAFGLTIGRPQTQTVFFVGDGTLAMTLGDLAPIARYAVPMIIVVLNDRAYGAERHFLDLHHHPHAQAVFPDTDYAGVARALGIEAATIRTIDDLRAQSDALTSQRERPLLLDCKITPELRSAWIEEMV
jgi:acetolactate synthase-1/2/3 large subunit